MGAITHIFTTRLMSHVRNVSINKITKKEVEKRIGNPTALVVDPEPELKEEGLPDITCHPPGCDSEGESSPIDLDKEEKIKVHPEAQPQNYIYMMDDEPEDQSEARPPGARKTHGWAG
ncbi:hypothetical protein Bbelb_049760 [Branchiostoma belcheri]|nr:hypothetical protein Bbelb_049760 [Branchiostoma belcheri]